VKEVSANPTASQLHRYLCVFAGARDHYQVAWALAETGRLERLVSDFYLPAFPGWAQRLVAFFDRRGRAKNRSCEGLSGDMVVVPRKALVAEFMDRSGRSRWFTAAKDRALGQACGRLATERRLPVLAYSYYASYAFAEMPADLRRIIFQVHPHPATVRRILSDELVKFPGAGASLRKEHELNFAPADFERLAGEALAAHFAITPSKFARQSLIEAGMAGDNIAVVPYGIDTEEFKPKRFSGENRSHRLRLIFVGSMIQRKGLGYLLEAMRRLQGEPVELVLVGRGARDAALLKHYRDVPFRVVWNVSRRELVREMQAADVFVFPSLVESFAHVILEAMAVGLPVITTTNTAGPDLLEEGSTGFVGGIRDVDFLVEKIRWFLEHREAVERMGIACQREAGLRTWPRFRREIRAALETSESRWKS
jgi:glycosyltransferase involved in cell wall biosynthesis